ncbi:hypothetical protein HKW98_04395 [Stutzerimonas urumqiensis]|uniref:hypothetical protein n=1 Tax=Stutzerimonas urumqiensis TaxID=638269 RepID=UPI003BAC736E
MPVDEAAAHGLMVVGLREQVEACQRLAITHALRAADENWAQAARQLGLDASNLHRLARRLGIK